jgi:hypothetical protein
MQMGFKLLTHNPPPKKIMTNQKQTLGASCGLLVLMIASTANAAAIWEEDFTTEPPVARNSDSFVTFSGDSSEELEFGQWTTYNASVSEGELRVAPAAGTWRGATIVLDPSLFSGLSGDYSLEFDVTTDAILSGGYASVTIYAASGYSSASTDDHVIVDNYDTSAGTSFGVYPRGSGATVVELATVSYTADATGQSLDFTYDGTSAIFLEFASKDGGLTTFDNLAIIPEPSSAALLLGLTGLALVMRRRR